MGRGCTVTQRVREVSQPYGGYIRRRDMEVIPLGHGMEALHPEENISPSLMGVVVDYLTRCYTGTPLTKALDTSIKGMLILNRWNPEFSDKFKTLLNGIKEPIDEGLTNFVKLCCFDAVYRAGIMAYRPVEEVNPDQDTLENIKIMVGRSIKFLEEYGPKTLDGFTFEGGYTDVIVAGDGDYLTNDGLWDFKVSKQRVDKDQTLQILIYWRMGLYSIHPEFRKIKYLGIFNPRKNEIHRIAVEDIPQDVIDTVERDVIGYGASVQQVAEVAHGE